MAYHLSIAHDMAILTHFQHIVHQLVNQHNVDLIFDLSSAHHRAHCEGWRQPAGREGQQRGSGTDTHFGKASKQYVFLVSGKATRMPEVRGE